MQQVPLENLNSQPSSLLAHLFTFDSGIHEEKVLNFDVEMIHDSWSLFAMCGRFFFGLKGKFDYPQSTCWYGLTSDWWWNLNFLWWKLKESILRNVNNIQTRNIEIFKLYTYGTKWNFFYCNCWLLQIFHFLCWLSFLGNFSWIWSWWKNEVSQFSEYLESTWARNRL